MKIVFRFSEGFRISSAAGQPPFYPDAENFNVGTYHQSAADIADDIEGDNNMHFYYMFWVRHDLEDGGWITVVLNTQVQHQRAHSGTWQSADLVGHLGNYWGTLTRLYIQCVPYSDVPEMTSSYMDIDSVTMLTIPNDNPVTVTWDSHTNGETVNVTDEVETTYALTMTNTSGSSVEVRVGFTGGGASSTVDLAEDGTTDIPLGTDLTFSGGESREFVYSITTHIIQGYVFGVSCFPTSQIDSTATQTMRSLHDLNVEKRWQWEGGPTDAHTRSCMIKLQASA
jgi:hypothetical protein